MNWMSSVFFKVCLFGFIGLACPTALLKAEGIIKGTVLDKNSGEPVIGAAVMLEQTLKGLLPIWMVAFRFPGYRQGNITYMFLVCLILL